MSTPPARTTLSETLHLLAKAAFSACGYPDAPALVVRSTPPQRSQFQCNDAFLLAKTHHTTPLAIAEAVAQELQKESLFSSVTAAAPGFINMDISDEYLAQHTNATSHEEAITTDEGKETIVLDYGGANVAKPLHVGHLRTAIIGESLKRIARELGHTAISDVHLGDWGLQMGMIIHELSLRQPDLPYFDPTFPGPYPEVSPVSLEDLDLLYPEASAHAKADESVMQAAREATVELQDGRPGYRALWRHFLGVSVAALKRDYAALGVNFDLWLGESDANDLARSQTDELLARGIARVSDGATILDVAEAGDTEEIPPLLLYNSDGAVLYGGTDLATITERVLRDHPNRIIYVVDKRQSLHLLQVFRAAKKAGIVGDETALEHIGFGTMNGTDGKPFKTRAGGTMKLHELTLLLTSEAQKRIEEAGGKREYPKEEQDEIARQVGIATLKFADLSNYREKDYVFDPKRFSSFEGYTGPYLLYSTVRARSILAKEKDASFLTHELSAPQTAAERELHLLLDAYPQTLRDAWEKRSPSELANYAFALATAFSSFYHESPVLSETDPSRKATLLHLVALVEARMTKTLSLLGIEVPKRM